jgi:hypothetical protein
VLVLPSAIATIPLEEGSTEKVVPEPTATPPPATIVVEPPTMISGLPSLSSSGGLLLGRPRIGVVLLPGAGIVTGAMGAMPDGCVAVVGGATVFPGTSFSLSDCWGEFVLG